ncbi:MAG TPA: stage III sporulation protein AG [Neobacillus sp.]|jgi:stage III sporulation protein AG
MDNNKGPLSWLKKWLKMDEKPNKKMGKYQYMLLVLCVGAAFMLVSNVFFKTSSTPLDVPTSKSNIQAVSDVPAFGQKNSSGNKAITDYEKSYESQLKKALNEMLGVNDVTVVVTIDSTDKKILEKNKSTKSQTTNEIDRDGGERKVQESSTDEQVVITRDGGKEAPIVTETMKPEVRGVLIVARGAENIQVKKWIVEAVTRALGVPSYRVAVVPKPKK